MNNIADGTYVGYFHTNVGADDKMIGSATVDDNQIVSIQIQIETTDESITQMHIDEMLAQSASFGSNKMYFYVFNMDIELSINLRLFIHMCMDDHILVYSLI